MTWQDEVTPQQWEEWHQFVQNIFKLKRINTNLGAEDYTATAVEKILMQVKKPYADEESN
jgi:hypothetical protein